MARSSKHRWSHRRSRWRRGRSGWTFGILMGALLLPIMLASSSPLLAALIPGALITMAGVNALDGANETESQKALPAQVVSPNDLQEQHRIQNAIEVPDRSLRV